MQRSNGKIEPGWIIQGFDNMGNAVVIKDQGDGTFIKKTISIEELERLNKNPPITDLKQAQSLDDLYLYLESIEGLQGLSHFYPREVLIKLVRDVVDGKKGINSVTRTEGLRDRVLELISKHRAT